MFGIYKGRKGCVSLEIKELLKQVVDELGELPHEEFEANLRAATEGEWGRMMNQLWEFEDFIKKEGSKVKE